MSTQKSPFSIGWSRREPIAIVNMRAAIPARTVASESPNHGANPPGRMGSHAHDGTQDRPLQMSAQLADTPTAAIRDCMIPKRENTPWSLSTLSAPIRTSRMMPPSSQGDPAVASPDPDPGR